MGGFVSVQQSQISKLLAPHLQSGVCGDGSTLHKGELLYKTLVKHGAVPDGYMADFVNFALCSSREVLLVSPFLSVLRDLTDVAVLATELHQLGRLEDLSCHSSRYSTSVSRREDATIWRYHCPQIVLWIFGFLLLPARISEQQCRVKTVVVTLQLTLPIHVATRLQQRTLSARTDITT